jgi:hypothetical protein
LLPMAVGGTANCDGGGFGTGGGGLPPGRCRGRRHGGDSRPRTCRQLPPPSAPDSPPGDGWTQVQNEGVLARNHTALWTLNSGTPGPSPPARPAGAPPKGGRLARPPHLPRVVCEDAVAEVKEFSVPRVELVLPVQVPPGRDGVVPKRGGGSGRPPGARRAAAAPWRAPSARALAAAAELAAPQPPATAPSPHQMTSPCAGLAARTRARRWPRKCFRWASWGRVRGFSMLMSQPWRDEGGGGGAHHGIKLFVRFLHARVSRAHGAHFCSCRLAGGGCRASVTPATV